MKYISFILSESIANGQGLMKTPSSRLAAPNNNRKIV